MGKRERAREGVGRSMRRGDGGLEEDWRTAREETEGLREEGGIS